LMLFDRMLTHLICDVFSGIIAYKYLHKNFE